MIAYNFQSSRVCSLISLFFLLTAAPSSYCQEDDIYSECAKPFNCGNLTNIFYPFWGEGRPEMCDFEGFKLQCRDGDFPVITFENQEFIVKSVNQSQKEMVNVPRILWDDTCPPNSTFNINLNTNLFSNTPNFDMMFSNISLFYNCSNLQSSVHKFSCSVNGEKQDAFYAYDELGGEWWQETSKCTIKVEVPVLETAITENGLNVSGGVLKEGFSIRYNYNETCDRCRESRGICGTDITDPGSSCPCPDYSHPVSCPGSQSNLKTKIIVAMGVVGTLPICGVIGFALRKRHLRPPRNNIDFEAFLEKHGPLAVKRYSYSQVKKMTNSFNEKLGQGGYGSVYKGTLMNGRLAAVKILNVSKGGEEFLNEVAAISRTSHVNVVTLLGFCMEGHKRALIYEFMPNGSLDKLICHETTLKIDQMHQIVTGVAQGLEYLHRGCNTRIVHFDIKPHNILLDENFIPKISDFGLAKLCTRKESIVSMLEARGTIGYIAPEIFCRNFRQVSSKPDVYSFGMMILEIIGARKIENQRAEGNSSGDMYFPHCIYKSLEIENNDEDISKEGDIARKLKLVGLWCIQTNPLKRPTMSNVIEMLQGSIQTIDIPPKPFLSTSSTQFPLYSSTTSTV